jgi:hypothetical protein
MKVFLLLCFIVALAFCSETSSDATSSFVVVDGRSNKWWIQIVVSSGGASNVKLTSKGKVYPLERASWDKAGKVFLGKPSSAIPAGSTVEVSYNANGNKKEHIKWNFRNAPNYDGNGPVKKPKKTPKTPKKNQNKNKGGKGKKNNGSSKGNKGGNKGKSSVVKGLKGIYSAVNRFKRNTSAQPANIVNYDNSLLKKWKGKLNSAITAVGVKEDRTRSLIHALFALESETMYDSSGNALRDTSKDFDKLWKNYSPLNMNGDMLKRIGFKGNKDKLNKAGNIKLVVATLLQGIKKLGLEGFINFHRGGATGYKQPNNPEFKIPIFKNGIYHMMQKFEGDHSLWTDGRKVWADIDHV